MHAIEQHICRKRLNCFELGSFDSVFKYGIWIKIRSRPPSFRIDSLSDRKVKVIVSRTGITCIADVCYNGPTLNLIMFIYPRLAALQVGVVEDVFLIGRQFVDSRAPILTVKEF